MEQPNADLWMRIADTLNRLRAAAAAAKAHRTRAVALRQRAQELSAQLAPIVETRAGADPD